MLRPRRASGDDTLYARATPQKVELTETYSVDQEISRSPAIQQAGHGTGRIEVRVPYDGRDYFTRQAVADVERVLGSGEAAGEHRVTLGHLLLADHTNASGLRDVMRLHNQAGLIPLSVPVSTDSGTLDLTGDRQTCVITYDYQPDDPPIYPIGLTVEIDDPDSLIGAFEDEQTRVAWERENPSAVIERLRQEASFSTELLLKFVTKLSLPVKAGYRRLDRVVVKKMSVGWPTLTSLRSTKLHIGGPRESEFDDVVRYNPVAGRLEWEDVPLSEVSRREASNGPERRVETRILHSAKSLLAVGHPGELFKTDELEVNVEVEIPDYLLSGLEARLFDATGQWQSNQPELVTKLNLRTRVYPADIFAGRVFSPYQQFVFDDITPDENRVTDIVAALRNLKFKVLERWQDPNAPTWLLRAERSHGPDLLRLQVAVEGKRAVLDRQQILGSSVKLSGSYESGQLKISVLGTLPRDHKELTREMNALQQALRDHFRFHQTSRK